MLELRLFNGCVVPGFSSLQEDWIRARTGLGSAPAFASEMALPVYADRRWVAKGRQRLANGAELWWPGCVVISDTRWSLGQVRCRFLWVDEGMEIQGARLAFL